jgi:hypothetical protein
VTSENTPPSSKFGEDTVESPHAQRRLLGHSASHSERLFLPRLCQHGCPLQADQPANRAPDQPNQTKSTWCRLHSTAMPLSCAISRRSDSADTAAAGSRLATGSSARIMRLSCVRTRASGGGIFIGRVSGASPAPDAAGWRSASPRSACDMAAADVVAALVLPTPARATGGVLRDAHGSQQNRQQRGGGSCFLRLLS